MRKPLFVIPNTETYSNPRSVAVAAELEKVLGAVKSIVTKPPVPNCFESVAGWTFPIVDGVVANGKAWVRLPPAGPLAPDIVRGLKHYYRIGEKAVSTPEMLEFTVREIYADACGLVASSSKQSAVRVAHAEAPESERSLR